MEGDGGLWWPVGVCEGPWGAVGAVGAVGGRGGPWGAAGGCGGPWGPLSRTRAKWLERFSIHLRKPPSFASRMVVSSEVPSEPFAWTRLELPFARELADPSDLAEPLAWNS